MFSGAPSDVVDRIADACMRIGVAWQLSDDVLDVASTSSQSGKEPGTDLRQGVRTLPVLYALRASSPGSPDSLNSLNSLNSPNSPEKSRLRYLLTEADLTDTSLHAEALSLLRSSSALEEARSAVREWAGEARSIVSSLQDVPARAAFESLCDFVITRTG
jgi:heptaprenyl diphosphate synthase